nr:hypothetical protein [Ktedonobacteraceae bacterium]
MTTALTVYAVDLAATTITTPASFITTGGGSGLTQVATKCGTSTGWGEIYGLGTVNAWPALGSIGSPSGNGWLFDVTTLEGQPIVAGNWSATWTMSASGASSITATLTLRFYKRSSGGYTSIGSITTSGAVLATGSGASVSFANTSLSSMSFATGDKLYVDLRANITGASSSSTATMRWKAPSSNTAGSTSAQVVTPGYGNATTLTTTINESIGTPDALMTGAGDGEISITETLSGAYVESTVLGDGEISITDSIGTPDALATNANSNNTTTSTTTITEQVSSAYAESTLSGNGSITIAETMGSASAETVPSGSGSTAITEALSTGYAESTISGSGTMSINDVITTPYAESTVSGSGTITINEVLSSAYAEATQANSAYVPPYVQNIALAQDTFTRSNQSGSFGTSSDGGTWSQIVGSGTLSVTSNEGVISSTSTDTVERLGTGTSTDQVLWSRVQINNTADIAGVVGRITGTGSALSAYKLLWYTNNVHINKTVSGTNTQLFTSASFTMTTGTYYNFLFMVLGSKLIGYVWQDGSAFPTSPTISGTDSSISSAGGFGILANTASSSNAKFDHFYVTPSYVQETISSFDASASIVGTGTTTITEQVSSADASATTTSSLVPGNTPITETIGTPYAETVAAGNGSITITESLSTAYAQATAALYGVTTINETIGVSDATATQARSSYVAPPPPPYAALVNDMYIRPNQSGLGTATDGNTYSIDSGAATLSINNNQGQITGVTGLT